MKGIAANYNLDLDLEAFLCSSSFWSRISVRCEWSHSTFNFVFGARPGPAIRPCQCTRWTLGKYLLLNWLSVVIPLFVSFQHLGCFFQHFSPKQPEFLFTIFWPYCGAQQPQAVVIWDWMRSKRIKFTVTIAWNIADLMWHHAADRIHCVNPTRPFIFVNFLPLNSHIAMHFRTCSMCIQISTNSCNTSL